MGVQGLRKLIESSGCARQLQIDEAGNNNNDQVQQQQQPTEAAVIADHVLIDMNGVIHGAFSRAQTDAKATIKAVLTSLRFLLEKAVTARRSLILCFDGPAPYAKLNTQRQRRRKCSHLDIANNDNFSDLSITTGSVFMLELEQHITRFLQQHSSAENEGFLSKTANISICGTSVPGEGEAKIASSLGRIAATLARNENDSVIVIGNDIDLVLTCIAAVSFHNIGVLNPQTLQVIDVGSFIARWVAPEDPMSVLGKHEREKLLAEKEERKNKNGNNNIKNEDDDDYENSTSGGFHSSAAGFVSFANLPGARIDFVWLFMLNGSDYYDGMSDIALSLWKRYRMLKKQRSEFRLVSRTHTLITNSLRALFQCEQVELEGRKGGKRRKRDDAGSKGFDDFDEAEDDDLKGGDHVKADNEDRKTNPLKITAEQRYAAISLLNASLWALGTTVTGICPNFRFRPVDPKQMEDSSFVTSQVMKATLSQFEEETIAFQIPNHIKKQIAGYIKEKKRREQARREHDQDSSQYSKEEIEAYYAKKAKNKQLERSFVTAQKFKTIEIHHPLAPLSPLQTFVALMPRKDLLPKPVQKVLEKNPELADDWGKTSFAAGSSNLASAVRRIFDELEIKELSPAERFLTQFGDPVDIKGGFFRGHPNNGVLRSDPEGNRKYCIDFFRFGYGSKTKSDVLFPKVAPDLVPGAVKMNATAALAQKKTTKDQVQAARLEMKRKAKAANKKGAGKNVAEQKEPVQHTADVMKGKRQLFWYDVFSKSSRKAVV